MPSCSRCCATTPRRSRPATRPATGWSHLHLPLVEHCARRFRNRGEPFEDLVQVGTIGLIKSIDRFDTDRGVEFSTYATPTIIGEIKRYFRDKGWAIRVPRRLQELRMQIGADQRRADPEPGPLPHAARARRARSAARSRRSSRASSPATPTRRCPSTPATATTTAPARCSTRSASTTRTSSTSRSGSRSSRCSTGSGAREKQILLLRFFKNMTQSQIAEEIGVSQMHVSRLLNRTLEQLRTSLEVATELSLTGSGRPAGGTASAVSPRRRPAPRVERGVEQADQDDQRDEQRSRRRPGWSSPPQKLQGQHAGSAGRAATGPRAHELHAGSAPRRRTAARAVRRRRTAPSSPPWRPAGVQARRARGRRRRQEQPLQRPPATAATTRGGGASAGRPRSPGEPRRARGAGSATDPSLAGL